MKTSKRILATIVAVMLVMTSIYVPAFAAFTDLTEDSPSYTAATVLNSLGVINGYPDGSFGPEKNVTRAEFTAMLLRTRGMGSVGSTSLENPPFPDVTTSDVSWAIANIRTAREMGIINGYDDGTFKPNNNVLYEEAVKMIVCSLGYGNMGVEGATWYSKYLVTANSLGFLTGAGGAIGTPATRAVIANMLYNCLEVKIAENDEVSDKTILDNDLNLTKNIGYISATPQISLTTPDSNLRDDEIEITMNDKDGNPEASKYKVDDISKYKDMIGAQITFYYTVDKNSGYKKLTMASVTKTQTVEIAAANINAADSSSIEYYKSEDDSKTTLASINSDAVVIYNGKLDENETYGLYAKGMPTIGHVKLLDRDGDRKYDVVFIEDYEVWVVSSTTAANKTVTDNILRSSGKLVLDPTVTGATIKIVDINGKELSFGSILQNSVVSVKAATNGTPVITAVVTNETVTGSITGTNSKKGVTINGKTYKFSKQAPWNTGGGARMPEPVYGDSGKYFLDIEGNIIAYDLTETVTPITYGYLAGVSLDKPDGFTEVLTLSVSTKGVPNPSKNELTITTNTKINGTQVSTLAAAETELLAKVGEGIKYTIASGKEISEIVTTKAGIPANGGTEVTEGQTITKDSLTVLRDASDTDAYKALSWTYYTSGTVLKNSSVNKEIRLSGIDTILCIKDRDYEKMDILDFKNGTTYKVEAYDITATRAAKLLIVHDYVENVEQTKATSLVIYVDAVTQDIINEEIKTVIDGYAGQVNTDYYLSSENTIDVQDGDVVRLKEKNGEYIVTDVIFRNADRTLAINGGHVKDNEPVRLLSEGSVKYRAVWGSAHLIDDSPNGKDVIVTTNVLTSANPLASDIQGEYILEKSWFSNAKILEYDVENDEFTERTEGNNLGVINDLTYSNNDDAKVPSEVFVYMNGDASVATMIIIVNRP